MRKPEITPRRNRRGVILAHPAGALAVTFAAAVLLMTDRCPQVAAGDTDGVRFVLEVPVAPAGESSAVYVQLNNEDDQPGWIRVAHADGEKGRVYLKARCEIGDCGKAPAVCGASLPMVRDISAAGTIELTWDGMESTIDPTSGCERRTPAPPGRYVATFCHAREASIAGGDPRRQAQGTVTRPTCAEVPFELPTGEAVRWRVGGGGE